MLSKQCVTCNKTFSTDDSRRLTCSKKCAYERRSKSFRSRNMTSVTEAVASPKFTLPPPEELPAPYAKRVHDMWATLVGSLDSPTRIA